MVARNSSRRVKYRNIAFGDQGMFFRKEYFYSLGHFKNIDFMEDYDFSIRVKKNGDRIKLLDQKIYSSGRRFINNGLWKTIITMQKAQSMYRRGKALKKLEESTDYLENVRMKCISCNKCKKACPFLNKYDLDLKEYTDRVDLAYNCFMCGKCKSVCPMSLDGKKFQ